MRLYLEKTVYEAALDRIRWCYDEFENVVVCFSGGKDSTVLLNLTIQVAKEKGRLPVPVQFIDQEHEWDSVLAYMRRTMSRPEVEPRWFQVPSVDATITNDRMQYCWKPGGPWSREKEKDSLKIDLGTTDFFQLMQAGLEHFHKTNACQLSGVRGTESSGRILAVTSDITYEGLTWGKVLSHQKKLYAFYPLYDWGMRDVWKAIYDGDWDYCEIYDKMFQNGYALDQMRISDLFSSTSVRQLQRVAELEPETWERLVKILPGASALAHLQEDYTAKELPSVFGSWVEYREYLLENLVSEKEREVYRKRFKKYEARFGKQDYLIKYEVNSILVGDRDGIRLRNLASEFAVLSKNVLTRKNPRWDKND